MPLLTSTPGPPASEGPMREQSKTRIKSSPYCAARLKPPCETSLRHPTSTRGPTPYRSATTNSTPSPSIGRSVPNPSRLAFKWRNSWRQVSRRFPLGKLTNVKNACQPLKEGAESSAASTPTWRLAWGPRRANRKSLISASSLPAQSQRPSG